MFIWLTDRIGAPVGINTKLITHFEEADADDIEGKTLIWCSGTPTKVKESVGEVSKKLVSCGVSIIG